MKQQIIAALVATCAGIASAQTGKSVAGDIFGAIMLNDMDAVSTMLSTNKEATLGSRTGAGITPLHYAASLDSTEAVFRLLNAGMSVDTQTEGSLTTPLHWAADKGAKDTLRLLLRQNANVNAAAKNGFTPLHFAARGGNTGVAKFLLEAGAAIDAQDGRGGTALHLAASGGKGAFAEFLLSKGADRKSVV